MSRKPKPLTLKDILKYETAAELGLAAKLEERGWSGMTAEETGRIGGIVAAKLKQRGE